MGTKSLRFSMFYRCFFCTRRFERQHYRACRNCDFLGAEQLQMKIESHAGIVFFSCIYEGGIWINSICRFSDWRKYHPRAFSGAWEHTWSEECLANKREKYLPIGFRAVELSLDPSLCFLQGQHHILNLNLHYFYHTQIMIKIIILIIQTFSHSLCCTTFSLFLTVCLQGRNYHSHFRDGRAEAQIN